MGNAEVGMGNVEVGMRNAEVGMRKWEVGMRKSDDRSWSSEFGMRKSKMVKQRAESTVHSVDR